MSRKSEISLAEDPVLTGVDGEEVDVVEVPDSDAAARVAVRLILERRLKLRWRVVALGLVEELVAMPVRIEEAVRGPVPEVAVEPRALDPAGLECRDPPLERLGAVRPVREVPDARPARSGELQRRALVVTEAPQVHRVAALARDLHAEDLPEVVEALVRLRRQQLDV